MKNSYQHFGQSTQPSFFIQGPSALARLIFFSVLSLALIATDSRLHYLHTIRQQLENYLHPLALMANAPAALYQQASSYMVSHDRLLAENKVLRNRMLKAKVALQRTSALKVENDYLRQIVNVQKQLSQKSILGEILHASSKRTVKNVVINRGAKHGVVLGAAVLDPKGVVGQVTSLYSQTSVVTLITNKFFEIPVMVERNGLRAIVFGQGVDNQLEIPHLPANVDIHQGDKLVTSGIDGVYPAGFAVGIVETVSVATGSTFIQITCAPVGGIDYHRQILVVNPDAAAAAQLDEKAVDDQVKETVKDNKAAKGQASARASLESKDESSIEAHGSLQLRSATLKKEVANAPR